MSLILTNQLFDTDEPFAIVEGDLEKDPGKYEGYFVLSSNEPTEGPFKEISLYSYSGYLRPFPSENLRSVFVSGGSGNGKSVWMANYSKFYQGPKWFFSRYKLGEGVGEEPAYLGITDLTEVDCEKLIDEGEEEQEKPKPKPKAKKGRPKKVTFDDKEEVVEEKEPVKKTKPSMDSDEYLRKYSSSLCIFDDCFTFKNTKVTKYLAKLRDDIYESGRKYNIHIISSEHTMLRHGARDTFSQLKDCNGIVMFPKHDDCKQARYYLKEYCNFNQGQITKMLSSLIDPSERSLLVTKLKPKLAISEKRVYIIE